MGSFNVTCCVTKTPIVGGDKCVVVRFDAKDPYEFMCSELMFQRIRFNNFKLELGKYYDYGQLEGSDTEFQDNSDDLIREEPVDYTFFISLDAWKFGENLVKKTL